MVWEVLSMLFVPEKIVKSFKKKECYGNLHEVKSKIKKMGINYELWESNMQYLDAKNYTLYISETYNILKSKSHCHYICSSIDSLSYVVSVLIESTQNGNGRCYDFLQDLKSCKTAIDKKIYMTLYKKALFSDGMNASGD